MKTIRPVLMNRLFGKLFRKINNTQSLKRTPVRADAATSAEFFIYLNLAIFIFSNAFLTFPIDRTEAHAEIPAASVRVALLLFNNSYSRHKYS